MKQNTAQKGFAPLLGILILAAVLTLAAAGGYIFYSKKVTSALPVQTTVTSPSLAPSASPSLSSESGVRNRWCLSKDPSLLPVYKCDPKTYKIPPAGPGMSVRYADEKGDEITSCGGSIPNIQESEKCKSLELLKCEENICDKTDETDNWKTYTSSLGFSFRYPPENYSAENDNEILLSRRSNIDNIRQSFLDLMKYDPPVVIVAIYIKYKNEGENSVRIWKFENQKRRNINEWYERYRYYPFSFGQAVKNIIDEEKPVKDIDIGGIRSKYFLRRDMQLNQEIYTPLGDKMFLIQIEGESTDSNIGNQILSTLKFLP